MVQFQKLTRNLFLILHGAKRTPSAAPTVQVSHALPAVRFSCLLRGHGTSLQHGVAAGSHRKPFPAATPCCKLAPQPCSRHEKRTAGSAWETSTVAAADGVRFARVRWEINFLLTFETALFICKHPVLSLLSLVRSNFRPCKKFIRSSRKFKEEPQGCRNIFYLRLYNWIQHKVYNKYFSIFK